MNIDLQQALMAFSLINGICTVVLGITVWLRKPGEDAGHAVQALREWVAEELAENANRLATIEERVKHMPTSEELAELEGTVRAIDERTRGMVEMTQTVRTQLNRIEDFLMKMKVSK